MKNIIKLSQAEYKVELVIASVDTFDEELNKFLFSLGCYEGEKISLISKISSSYVIAVKNARYNIDKELANVIMVYN